MGFEPTTASLEGWNSTTELRPPRLHNHPKDLSDSPTNKYSGPHDHSTQTSRRYPNHHKSYDWFQVEQAHEKPNL